MGVPEFELGRYHRTIEPEAKPRPRVRLPKMVARFVRVAELLRHLDERGPSTLTQLDAFSEMARRGTFDVRTHFERYRGAIRVTDEAKVLMHEARSYCQDWSLIHVIAGRSGTRGAVWAITRDGKETLDDWDDLTANCIYGSAQ